MGIFAPAGRSSAAGAPEHVLIVEPFGLGDCVFVNGMIGALRRQWRSATVHVVCKPDWAWLFSACPNTQVHSLRAPWVAGAGRRGRSWLEMVRVIQRLRRVSCEIGFDVRGDVRSQAILLAAGCCERIGYTTYGGSNMVLRGTLLTRIAEYHHEHRAHQNLRLLDQAGISSPVVEYCFPQVPEPARRFVVTVHPGAGWRYKLWKAERWAQLIGQLATRLPGPFQLLAHRSEQHMVDQVLRGLDVPVTSTVTDDLPGLARALKATDAYIGLDSGALHLAVALGVRALGLYGPGITELFYPLSPTAAMLTKQKQFSCAPCLQRSCVHPDATCMDAIGVEEVVRLFLDRLNGS